jgi:asparagine synthase (glutamine-hydrolysing)
VSAFAAILTSSDTEPDPDPTGAARVCAALTRLSGTSAVPLIVNGCALISASLHARDAAGPFVDAASGIAAVGQVMLEGATELAHELGARPDVSDLGLVAFAYLRWGERCTERLSGEYAFALWDGRRRTLLAARDGLGIRVLYAAQSGTTVVVSNVMAATLSTPGVPDTLDDRALVSYLATGAIEIGKTAYRSVRMIPAGHTLRICDGRPSLARHWWFPRSGSPRLRRSNEEILEGYRAVLERAVADRVRRRPVAILLSGGVDSTTMAAAARATQPSGLLQGLTAVYNRLSPLNELAYARMAADRLGIPLTAVAADTHEALDALWQGGTTPQPLDEPTLSDWRALVGAAAARGSAILYGEGGDMLLLPPGWHELRRETSFGSLSGAIGRSVVRARRLPYLGLRLRERLRYPFGVPPKPLPAWLSDAAIGTLRQGEPLTILGQQPEPLPPHSTRMRAQARLGAEVSRDLAMTIAPEVTGHAIEFHCPLLDTRVVRFVMNVPAIPWCQHKTLPRLAYRADLPDAVLSRPKTGVIGFYEALTASWSKTRPAPVPLHPMIDAWVLRGPWLDAIRRADSADVTVAWRVLQLNAWLSRRRESIVSGEVMCTA